MMSDSKCLYFSGKYRGISGTSAMNAQNIIKKNHGGNIQLLTFFLIKKTIIPIPKGSVIPTATCIIGRDMRKYPYLPLPKKTNFIVFKIIKQSKINEIFLM